MPKIPPNIAAPGGAAFVQPSTASSYRGCLEWVVIVVHCALRFKPLGVRAAMEDGRSRIPGLRSLLFFYGTIFSDQPIGVELLSINF
ncbi:hypothetical protein [Phormidium sp. CCY1219]|uniref:hypothetical protein n=1 Tax=Phormidium sp. CCY1219 TaxID=2886104 RepID=UPI002D1EBA05|nr:hypothetical protein [Phormidium sp. CCY1219]MEB3826973.1 hypothetical protein [Phormidium sp. CCY1219]